MHLPFWIEPQVQEGGAKVGLQVSVWKRAESLINNNARLTSVFRVLTAVNLHRSHLVIALPVNVLAPCALAGMPAFKGKQ